MPDDPKRIPSNSAVYRRIAPEWWVSDGSGGKQISSQAFQDNPDYMSVALGVLLDELGVDPTEVLVGFDGYGLARLEVAFLRGIQLGVTEIPAEEPWHGGVHGKKTGGKRKQLKANAIVVVTPAE